MKKYILIGWIFALATYANGQSIDHETWKLSTKTTMDTVKKIDLDSHAYHYLFYKQNHQIYFDKKGGGTQKFIATHARIRINSAKGVRENSSIRQSGTDVLFQYRIIKADGEVIDKVKNEKENVDLESIFSNSNALYYFSGFLSNSFEGLDSNCELEYIYVTKINSLRSSDEFGVDYIQKSVPIYNYTYNLITPDILVYKIIGLNGCPAATDDESDDKNYLTLDVPYVDAFYRSPITATGANKIAFNYKFFKNKQYSQTQELLKYSTVAKNVYERYMNTNKEDLKLIKKYLDKHEDLQNKTDLDRIKALEYALKKDFGYAYGFSLSPMKEVFAEKKANVAEMSKLFAMALNYWGEGYELVYCFDRTQLPYDDTYDNYAYLDDMLIYLPKRSVYISPGERRRYMDLISSSFRENKAVFIKKIGVKSFESGKDYIDSIPALDYNKNYLNEVVNITLESQTKTAISIATTIGGMEGLPYWNTLINMDYESEEDFFTGLSKYKVSDAILNDSKLEPIDKKKSTLDEPVKYTYAFNSQNLAQYSNNTIAVNIGGLINEAKAVQEKPKGNYSPEIYSGYKNTKQITITIPKGYKLSNAASLDLDKKYASAGEKDAMVYEVKHQIEGDKLTLTITEIFNRGNFYPADMDNFLQVYNAGWNLKDLTVKFVKE